MEDSNMNDNSFKRNGLLAQKVIKGLASRNMTGYYAVRVVTLTLILSLMLGLCSCTQSKPRPQSLITDVVETNENAYECKFKEQTFKFMLFLPEKTDKNTPLILMLTGKGNNSSGFRLQTHMDEDACPRGYAVCYVQPAKGNGGWGWDCGLLEPGEVDSLEYLINLVIYLQDEYGLSKTKAFAAGFSNGGYMIHRVAMEGSDTFLAGASVAGTMTALVWNERQDKLNIGVLEIYGTKDDAVPQNGNGTAAKSPHPAIEEVMDYWASANGLDSSSVEALSDKSELTKNTARSSKTQVWSVKIEDGVHEWPKEEIAGFNTNDLILDYFDLFC